MNYLEQMGIMAVPLLACSSIALAIVVERILCFVRIHALPKTLIQQLITHPLPLETSLKQKLERHRLGRLFLELLQYRTLPNNEREQMLSLKVQELQEELTRLLPFLKMISAIAPLLGLLGTVLGMMEAFNAIAQTQGAVSPSLIAKGISQAMLTTAAGLMIAIPSFIAHAFFQMRANMLLQQITRQLNLMNQHWFSQRRLRKAPAKPKT